MNKLQELWVAAREAIEYVGAANYPEREREAIKALHEAFVNYSNNIGEIVFKVKDPD